MSISAGSIQNFILRATIQMPALAPLAVQLPLSLALNFADLTNLQETSGTYTPNNDYMFPVGSNAPFPVGKEPNFFILVCTGQINLTVTANGNFLLAAAPVKKLLFMHFDSGLPLSTIYFEGRTNAPLVMPQGIPVDYMFISGTATIS